MGKRREHQASLESSQQNSGTLMSNIREISTKPKSKKKQTMTGSVLILSFLVFIGFAVVGASAGFAIYLFKLISNL